MFSFTKIIVAKYKIFNGLFCLLEIIAAVIALPCFANAGFLVFDNPSDANFNQLLGINDGRVIVGNFGANLAADLTPSNGYILVPLSHYSAENFMINGSPAAQTKVTALNDRQIPQITGYYTDGATGFTHGFLDIEGVQLTVDDPAGVAGIATPVQKLLGINNNQKAVGYWTDNGGNAHGFLVLIAPKTHVLTFVEVGPNYFPGAVATKVIGITDSHTICGYWTDASNNSHGFYAPIGGKATSFDVPFNGKPAKSTEVYGCNDIGQIVGAFTDAVANVHGFYSHGFTFYSFDAPGSKQITALGVKGTVINGVNNWGALVGYFSDGSKVHGFVNYLLPNGPE